MMLKILLMIINLQLGYYQPTALNELNKSYNHKFPSNSEVYDYMLSKDLIWSDIWIKVAQTETQMGKTGVGKTKNNLFGIRYTKEYKYFDCWQSSVDSLVSIVNRKLPIHNEKYHQKGELCSGYCFIEGIGWKMGIPYSVAERKYTNYLRRINLSFK